MWAVYVPGALHSQKRVPDLLELKLQMAVTHYEGAGNWAQVLCDNECPQWLNLLSGNMEEYFWWNNISFKSSVWELN